MTGTIERRDPGVVLLLSLVTCGLYLIYWYLKMYEELEELAGATPTGNSFGVDLMLVIITCTLWGVWVDYRISMQMNELQTARGILAPDTTTIAVGLDALAYVSGGLCNFITSAIHQDQLNKVAQATVTPHTEPGPF